MLCVGPTGTGKTLTAADKLIRGMPEKYMSDFLTFSARTSANQTQDIIDAKLDKRYVSNTSPYITDVRMYVRMFSNAK